MKTRYIKSRSNPRFKALRKELKAGSEGAFIAVEGVKLILEALKAGLKPESIWSHRDHPFPPTDREYRIPEDLYRSISPTKSGNAPLALFPSRLPAVAPSQLCRGRFLLLDQVQEPGNAGALVRAAAAFGLDAVLWHQPCVFPFHHACIRASAGSVFHLPNLYVEATALEGDVNLIGAATDGERDLASFCWPNNLVLVLGKSQPP